MFSISTDTLEWCLNFCLVHFAQYIPSNMHTKDIAHALLCFVIIWYSTMSLRYVKLRVVHAPGMPGTFSPRSRVSDPDMHYGTCVTHVPRCMPGSLTSRWRKNVPGPGACATRNFKYQTKGPCMSTPSGIFTDTGATIRRQSTMKNRDNWFTVIHQDL